VAVLVVASLVFYAWIDVWVLPVITGSILFNYGAARAIVWCQDNRPHWSRAVLVVALVGDLGLLGYFKYANFLLDTLGALTATGFTSLKIILPLGISFFTFTQIAFLVDVSQGKAREYNFLRYVLFVTYFPHLIAGPILHHGEMMPQFGRFGPGFRFSRTAAAVGLTCFAIGLLKKLALADTVAPVSDVVFAAAQAGSSLSMAEAWTGALAYTLQIYFDFSGYCDMAIGLSLLFGVRLPANFNSPYKAVSIIDFWRRWHMTLSRFLRDYVYVPLGGNRRGPWRRYVNLMATMLLGGLWHGAGWTFVAWGALHGLYLVINHLWRSAGLRCGRVPGWMLTFAGVVIAWVFFRADSIASAEAIIRSMLSFDGLSWARKLSFPNELVQGRLSTWGMEAGMLAIALALPNTHQLVARYRPVLEAYPPAKLPEPLRWRPRAAWGIATGLALAIGIALIGGDSPFLYFQF